MPSPFTREELEKQKKARDTALSITGYLNTLEEIFNHPMSEQEKAETFNQIALMLGKVMISFCDLCDLCGINEERGVRGGKKKTKFVPDSEDVFEYKEVD